jgi:hypothetical protein
VLPVMQMHGDDNVALITYSACILALIFPGLVVTIIMIEILGRKKTMALEFFGTMAGFLLLFVCSTS